MLEYQDATGSKDLPPKGTGIEYFNFHSDGDQILNAVKANATAFQLQQIGAQLNREGNFSFRHPERVGHRESYVEERIVRNPETYITNEMPPRKLTASLEIVTAAAGPTSGRDRKTAIAAVIRDPKSGEKWLGLTIDADGHNDPDSSAFPTPQSAMFHYTTIDQLARQLSLPENSAFTDELCTLTGKQRDLKTSVGIRTTELAAVTDQRFAEGQRPNTPETSNAFASLSRGLPG